MRCLKLPLALLCVTIAACGPQDRLDDFRNAVPSSKTVAFKVPGAETASQKLTAGTTTRQDRLEGDQAMMYDFTRGATRLVNGGVGATLVLLETIVSYPATSFDEANGKAVWGPVTEALSPITWKLTVSKAPKGDNVYTYDLQAKPKASADSAYVSVLRGTHSSAGAKLGQGSFTIDWDAAHTLPEHDDNVGKAMVVYSKLGEDQDVTIDADFEKVLDRDTNGVISATYRYTAHPGNGGSLDYSATKNLFGAAPMEQLEVRSRWAETGAGRSDVKATGGDLTETATLSECWDEKFASRYLLASFSTETYGKPSACVFASPEYATLTRP